MLEHEGQTETCDDLTPELQMFIHEESLESSGSRYLQVHTPQLRKTSQVSQEPGEKLIVNHNQDVMELSHRERGEGG